MRTLDPGDLTLLDVPEGETVALAPGEHFAYGNVLAPGAHLVAADPAQRPVIRGPGLKKYVNDTSTAGITLSEGASITGIDLYGYYLAIELAGSGTAVTNVRVDLAFRAIQCKTEVPVSNLAITDVAITRVDRRGVEIVGPVSEVLCQRVTVDGRESTQQDWLFGFYASGNKYGSVSGLYYAYCLAMGAQTYRGPRAYPNSDGFTMEESVEDVTFDHCNAIGNADAGYDLKAKRIRFLNSRTADNARNVRLWGSDVTGTLESLEPVRRFGAVSTHHVWTASTCRDVDLHVKAFDSREDFETAVYLDPLASNVEIHLDRRPLSEHRDPAAWLSTGMQRNLRWMEEADDPTWKRPSITTATPSAPVSVPPPTTRVEFTGAEEFVVIPPGVKRVRITARGGAGGDGRSGQGGRAAEMIATLPARPGSRAMVHVGQEGDRATAEKALQAWPDGSARGERLSAGGGGGATTVLVGDRVVVAAGGPGGGRYRDGAPAGTLVSDTLDLRRGPDAGDGGGGGGGVPGGARSRSRGEAGTPGSSYTDGPGVVGICKERGHGSVQLEWLLR